jgi:hypothetical protein
MRREASRIAAENSQALPWSNCWRPWRSFGKDGYKITPDIRQPEEQGGWILNATPEPRVTGSQSGKLRVFLVGGVPSYSIEFAAAPGANQGRARMLAAVRYPAAEAFAQLACALPYAERDGL